ncbi:MAG: glycoside hydrolase family protein [Methylobacterium sp.]|uniref:lysozyme n=1 Tax=Methylobacterium sp. TaxID=409 RepID=UPI0025CC18B2|nr:glycoside hydrolase family protein [Methylobacterium sp.]MBX9934448.1 glycoside hydrolase family protein [Methylobacterium sp.]
MDFTSIGRAVLIAREGRRLSAYRDSVGIWTIGIGHTSAAGPPEVTPGLRLSAADCDAIFRRDVARYAETVRGAVPADLPDHAFDALVSLCFNIGQPAFLRSTIVERLKCGDRDGAAAAILMWNRPSEVIPRRQAEFDQFVTPYSVAMPGARRGEVPVSVAPRRSAPGRRSIPRSPSSIPTWRPPATAAPPGLWRRLVERLRGMVA